MSRVSPQLFALRRLWPILLLAACAHGRDEFSGPDGQRISAVPASLDTVIDDTLDPKEGDSTDWRVLELGKPGQIDVQLHWDTEGPPLTLALHDELGNAVASGEAWGERGAKLLYNAESIGRYFVMVRAPDGGKRTPYSLKMAYQRLMGRRCHDCTPGQQICVGKDGYAICEATKEGCNAWVQVAACPAEQSCREGQCLAGCSDQCKPEERRCSGTTAAQVCVKNATGCYVWNEPVLCDTGYACGNGRCRKPEVAVKPQTPQKEEPQLVRGDIISVSAESGGRILYIRVGENSQVQAGQAGYILDGGSDKPLPSGDFKVVSVSGTTAKASTRIETLGNNRKVVIRIR